MHLIAFPRSANVDHERMLLLLVMGNRMIARRLTNAPTIETGETDINAGVIVLYRDE